MKKRVSILFLLIIMMNPTLVFAHPGRTDSSGCHYCRTNCAKYGLSDGEYHCHNGSSSSSSSNNSSSNDNSNGEESNDNSLSDKDSENDNNISSVENSSNNNILNDDSDSSNNSSNDNTIIEKEEIKSDDNTLKLIIIDGKEMKVENNINYSTTNENVEIKVTTNDEKSKYKINNNSNLKIGENNISIEVTSESGKKRIYNIIVNRERILSSDTGIKIKLNNEEINFTNNKATQYVSANEKTLKVDYTLNDKNAKVEMNKIDELKTGDNELKIKVIAEDGTEEEYEIIIHKYTKSEETGSLIIGLGIIGGMAFGVYYICNKIFAKFKKLN